MTNYLRIDMANSRLVMDKAFAKHAAIGDHPKFCVKLHSGVE